MVLVTRISEPLNLEVPQCSSGLLPVVIWSIGTLACWVALAAVVDADVTHPLWFCRCMAHLCVMGPGLTPGTKGVLMAVFPQVVPSTAEQWTSGLHVLFDEVCELVLSWGWFLDWAPCELFSYLLLMSFSLAPVVLGDLWKNL